LPGCQHITELTVVDGLVKFFIGGAHHIRRDIAFEGAASYKKIGGRGVRHLGKVE
jgi:hypothetical protein